MQKVNNIIAEKLRSEKYDINRTTYFDYQATTPCDKNVLLAMIPFFGCDVNILDDAAENRVDICESSEQCGESKQSIYKANACMKGVCEISGTNKSEMQMSVDNTMYTHDASCKQDINNTDSCATKKNNATAEPRDIIFGNPHARSHVYGWAAEKSMEYARTQIAKSINTDEECIIFTSGATESNNLAIKGLCEFWKSKKKHILTTEIEHKCALEAVKFMQRNGFEVSYVRVNTDGTLDLEAFEHAIRPDTLMLSISAVNHEIGTIQNLEEIGQICKRKGIFLHVDAAQAWGKLDIDVEKWNVDLMSLSAHKTYGPKGIGALYIRCSPKRVRIQPIIHGGGQERGFRSGTMPVPLCIGMGKAAELFCTNRNNMMLENIRVWLLHTFFLKQIESITHIYLNGPRIDHLTIADWDFIKICRELSAIQYLQETCMQILSNETMTGSGMTEIDGSDSIASMQSQIKESENTNHDNHVQNDMHNSAMSSTNTVLTEKMYALHRLIMTKRIPHNINISILGIEGESLMMEMSAFAFSSGSACTSANLEPSYVLQEIGVKEELLHSSIRVSFGRQTSAQDIMNFTTSMKKAVQKLRDMSPVWECVLEDRAIDSWNIDQK